MWSWQQVCDFFKPIPIKPITVHQSFPNQPPLQPTDARKNTAFTDIEVVARTIWGEARNQGLEGMTAVGCVIQNRAHIGGWWGKTPREVCWKPAQFSCWNANDPNRTKLLCIPDNDLQYGIALKIAQQVVMGTLNDITNGADSYEVRGTNAYWAKTLKPIASIGEHDFYRTMSA